MGEFFGIFMALAIGIVAVLGFGALGAFFGFLLGGLMGMKLGLALGVLLLVAIFMIMIKNA